MTIAADVAAGIAETQEVIAEIGESLTLRQLSEVPIDVTQPWLGVTNVPVDTAVKGVVAGYRLRDIDNATIRQGDLQVVVLAADLGAVTPQTDDQLIWAGATYGVVSIDPVPFNNAIPVYVLQVRA